MRCKIMYSKPIWTVFLCFLRLQTTYKTVFFLRNSARDVLLVAVQNIERNTPACHTILRKLPWNEIW